MTFPHHRTSKHDPLLNVQYTCTQSTVAARDWNGRAFSYYRHKTTIAYTYNTCVDEDSVIHANSVFCSVTEGLV